MLLNNLNDQQRRMESAVPFLFYLLHASHGSAGDLAW